MPKKLTHEEYVERLFQKHPTVEVLDCYVNTRTRILHKCKICGHEFLAKPQEILISRGCPICESKTRTQEQYIQELKEVNPNIEVIETFAGVETKIKHRCLIDGYEWYVRPAATLKGAGCPKCAGNYRKTQQEYVDEVANKNPAIIVLGKYHGAFKKIKHQCVECGYTWDVAPNDVLNEKVGCPRCHKHEQKTTEIYKQQVREKDPTIEVLGEYKNAKTRIRHRCLVCGNEWDVTPDGILSGHGCTECAKIKISNSKYHTHKEYVEMLKKANPNVVVLEEYKGVKTKILHKCVKHDYIWSTTPTSVLAGAGCPECKSEKISQKAMRTHAEYVEKLKIANPNIEVLDAYSGCFNKILHKCNICGHEWMSVPANILFGQGCPFCKESNGERKIRQWLEKNNINFSYQYTFEDCRDVNCLPFDFYLLDYNICIEYDGEQHYRAVDYFGGQERFEYVQRHDMIKNGYCKNNNIKLLRIPYFKNVEEELSCFLFT